MKGFLKTTVSLKKKKLRWLELFFFFYFNGTTEEKDQKIIMITLSYLLNKRR